MKLHEVLVLPEVESGEQWFRPVGSPRGYAYCVKAGYCYAVPAARGGAIGVTPAAELLSGEWEAVSPDSVLADLGQ